MALYDALNAFKQTIKRIVNLLEEVSEVFHCCISRPDIRPQFSAPIITRRPARPVARTTHAHARA